MWCWRRMENIKWSVKVTKEVLRCIGDKRTLLNNILHRKVIWVGHIVKRNCLLHDVIAGQMTEVKWSGKKNKNRAP